MKLRYLAIYNEYGYKTSPALQVWDEESKEWKYVKIVECKRNEINECNSTEDW